MNGTVFRRLEPALVVWHGPSYQILTQSEPCVATKEGIQVEDLLD